jgi:hypothetical protein
MGNNEEIRGTMSTYRTILLAVVWIGAGIGVIAGLVLAGNRYVAGIGIAVAIVSAVIGVIGHFMVNVLLAIPFILLNNGDTLEAILNQRHDSGSSGASDNSGMRKCPFCQENIKKEAAVCRYCGKDVKAYDDEQKAQKEKAAAERREALKGKTVGIQDILNDPEMMKEANNLRRIYGKSMYLSFIKRKAKELGLGDIDLTEEDIE